MAYATGKFAKALCDRCGFEYKLLELREEWNGLKVCPNCYEPKHPQLEPRKHKPDAQALQDARTPKKLNPAEQLENGSVSVLLKSLGVTADDRKITSTFKSDNATLLVSSLTLTASLGSESVSVS